MTPYRSQVISPIQRVNNIRIIAIPHRHTGTPRRTARTRAWKRAGAAHHTKPDCNQCFYFLARVAKGQSRRNTFGWSEVISWRAQTARTVRFSNGYACHLRGRSSFSRESGYDDVCFPGPPCRFGVSVAFTPAFRSHGSA